MWLNKQLIETHAERTFIYVRNSYAYMSLNECWIISNAIGSFVVIWDDDNRPFSFNHLLFGWRISFNFASPKLKVKTNYRVYFLHQAGGKEKTQNKRTNSIYEMRLHFTKYSFNTRLFQRKAKQINLEFRFCWWKEAEHRRFFCELKYNNICIEDIVGWHIKKKKRQKQKIRKRGKKEKRDSATR